jgi:hypothetical protein
MSSIQIRLKQELYSIMHAVFGCAFLALVLAGIGGTIYKVIAPEGWVALVFGRSLSAGAAALGSVALIGALAWFSRSWGDPRNRTFVADIMVYGFALAGFVYLALFLSKGTF